jgi:hypothetical protein
MPKKENRKGQKGIRIRNKVIVNVNTGKRTGNTRQAQRQPPPTGAFPKVMLLNPQPQIQSQNQLQANTQSRLQQALEKQLELQSEASSQRIQNLEDIINKQRQTLEEAQIEADRKTANRSQGQLNRYTTQPGYEASSSIDRKTRERERDPTQDILNRLEATVPKVDIGDFFKKK